MDVGGKSGSENGGLVAEDKVVGVKAICQREGVFLRSVQLCGYVPGRFGAGQLGLAFGLCLFGSLTTGGAESCTLPGGFPILVAVGAFVL